MSFHKPGRKIPHRPLTQDPTHLVLRLAGSISEIEIRRLGAVREEGLAELFRSKETRFPEAIKAAKSIIEGKYHLGIDHALHDLSNRPYHLNDPNIAKTVIEAFKWAAENERWFLYALCIMGNHLHAVVKAPENQLEADLGTILRSLKRHSAKQANLILGTTGTPFWEPIYYDREVRPGKFMRVMWYVLNNPVSAGLVGDWGSWPHTYVHPDYIDLFLRAPSANGDEDARSG